MADKQQEEALDIEARGGNSAKNGGREAKKEMGANWSDSLKGHLSMF